MLSVKSEPQSLCELALYQTMHCEFGVRIQTQVCSIHSISFQTVFTDTQLPEPSAWQLGVIEYLQFPLSHGEQISKDNISAFTSPLLDLFLLLDHHGALRTIKEGPICFMNDSKQIPQSKPERPIAAPVLEKTMAIHQFLPKPKWNLLRH